MNTVFSYWLKGMAIILGVTVIIAFVRHVIIPLAISSAIFFYSLVVLAISIFAICLGASMSIEATRWSSADETNTDDPYEEHF